MNFNRLCGGCRLGIGLTIFAGIVHPPDGTKAEEARKVHALIAVDKGANLVNNEANRQNFERLLKSVQIGVPTDGPPSPYQVEADRVSIKDVDQLGGVNPKSIKAFFENNDDIGINDVVLFYYSGHGGTDPTRGALGNPSTWHFLHTSGGDLMRSDLLSAMNRRPHRLTIILTDCCSSVGSYSPKLALGIPESARVMRSLLFQHRGLVNITGATYDATTGKGEYGWFTEFNLPDDSKAPGGGIFTMSLCNVIENTVFEDLDRDRDGSASWDEVIQPLRLAMDTNFKSMKQQHLTKGGLSPQDEGFLRGQDTQQPWVFQSANLDVDGGDLPPQPRRKRPFRFGALITELPGRGVIIQSVVPGSPASRVTVQENNNGVPTTRETAMMPNDLIQFINDQPVRSLADFYRELDSIPRGGMLHIKGLDAYYRWQRGYTASVELDTNGQ